MFIERVGIKSVSSPVRGDMSLLAELEMVVALMAINISLLWSELLRHAVRPPILFTSD
jgi:hypothetical protein